MATLGLIFIGLLIGLFLSLVLAVFAILRLDPRLRSDLLERRVGLRELLPRAAPQGTTRTPDLSQKVASLKEEVRLNQRLADQRVAQCEDLRRELEQSRSELATVRQRLEVETGNLPALREEVAVHLATVSDLRDQLTGRERQLAHSESELKSLRLELDLLQQDEDTTKLEHLQQP